MPPHKAKIYHLRATLQTISLVSSSRRRRYTRRAGGASSTSASESCLQLLLRGRSVGEWKLSLLLPPSLRRELLVEQLVCGGGESRWRGKGGIVSRKIMRSTCRVTPRTSGLRYIHRIRGSFGLTMQHLLALLIGAVAIEA